VKQDCKAIDPGKEVLDGYSPATCQTETAIQDYLLRNNANPKTFVWTAPAKVILQQERRAVHHLNMIKSGYQALESEHQGSESNRVACSQRRSQNALSNLAQRGGFLFHLGREQDQ
jgi:hypothetical protein